MSMADNAPLYRAILDVFGGIEAPIPPAICAPTTCSPKATWPGGPPTPETVQQALDC